MKIISRVNLSSSSFAFSNKFLKGNEPIVILKQSIQQCTPPGVITCLFLWKLHLVISKISKNIKDNNCLGYRHTHIPYTELHMGPEDPSNRKKDPKNPFWPIYPNENLRPIFNRNILPMSGKNSQFWPLENVFFMRKSEKRCFFSQKAIMAQF